MADHGPHLEGPIQLVDERFCDCSPFIAMSLKAEDVQIGARAFVIDVRMRKSGAFYLAALMRS